MTVTKKVTIRNKSGLHARPAALFVQIANKFDCEIAVTKGRHEVNGKSIMGILMLAASKGQTVIISANGDDAEQAVKELSEMLLSDADYELGNRIKGK